MVSFGTSPPEPCLPCSPFAGLHCCKPGPMQRLSWTGLCESRRCSRTETQPLCHAWCAGPLHPLRGCSQPCSRRRWRLSNCKHGGQGVCTVPLAWPLMYCCSHPCRNCCSNMGATNPMQHAHLLPPPFFGARPFACAAALPPADALGASSLPETCVFPVAPGTPPPHTRDMQGVDLTGRELKAH